MPQPTTRRQQSDAAKARAAKNKSVVKMSARDFCQERRKNPYEAPKDRRSAEGFHTLFQEKIFYEVFPQFKTRVVQQFCINTDYMEKHMDYFSEAVAICKEFGIYEFIGLQEDYNSHLIMQFFATVHFFPDEPRRIKWMTKGVVLEATWSDFASLLDLGHDMGIGRAHV